MQVKKALVLRQKFKMLRQKHDKKFNTQSIGVLNVKTIVCCFVPLRLISGHYWNTIPPSGFSDIP